MAKNGYTVTKSNYTLKKYHSKVSGGTVYERDFMTTNNLGGWNSGSIPYSENSFKMVYRDSTNTVRKHNFGEYLKNENGSEQWTIASGASKSLSSESEIKVHSDNSTLLSYAYYGNCTQLVQSGIRKIINNFPAEIWSTEETAEGIKELSAYTATTYILNNEFDIDITTRKLSNEEELEVNPFRYFYLSFQRYFVTEPYSGGCINEWIVENVENDCNSDKLITLKTTQGQTIKIRRCILNKKYVYLTNVANLKIKLGNADIESFFDSLDDFQKLLLNRDTNPLYTATLDFPHETERGVETYKKAFTWPVINGWNLDITSSKYAKYVNSLLDLATFYDEYNTDNLWKNMTHDSIKNMDITFSRKGSDEDKDDYNEGTTKVQGLLWAYGRQFDELKRSIDNIKSVNNITYSEDGNIPDYFLTDSLNLAGWEVTSAVKGLTQSATTKDLFTGKTKEYTINDTNVIFLKNLKINSANILSKKGTRRGIEDVLGLFGYVSDDYVGSGSGNYILEEEVVVAQARGEGTHVLSSETLSAETFNSWRSEPVEAAEGEDYDTLHGLPVILFYYYDNNVLKKTIIPWFKDVTEIDGNPYFQMYGGWGKITDITGNTAYTETISYLNIVKNYTELKKLPKSKLLKKDYNIVYVNDISDYTGDTETTHYFITTGETESGETIWSPISSSDTKVVEISSIIEEYRGNNPHTGYGNYDSGEGYLDIYRRLFGYLIDNDLLDDRAYECGTGEILSGIKAQGFELSAHTDNKKCYYFYDKDKESLEGFYNLRKLKLNNDKYTYTSYPMGYVEGSPCGIDIRGEESGNTNTIYSEYSIINTKKLVITFRAKHELEEKYIQQSVLPYLMQMVPSTTILEIKYEN